MAQHARIGPSSAPRWMHCPASVRMSDPNTSPHPELLPKSGGRAATIGTILHDAFEQSMILGEVVFLADHAIGIRSVGGDSKESLALLRSAFSAAQKLISDFDLVNVKLEVRLHPGARVGSKDLWGTCDLLAVSRDTTHLVIADLKMGKHAVSPDSPQLLVYATGARVLHPNVKKITTAIIQPTVSVTYSSKTFSSQEMDVFEDKLRDVVVAIEDHNTQPTPTFKACQWCPASSFCPSRSNGGESFRALDVSGVEFA